ncbi:O-antigen ligase family protein [bacterium]|nr:O-antigen ligase family protein [bacterium]
MFWRITKDWKRCLSGRSLLLTGATIITLYIVARALLCPQTGKGIFDGTLLGLVTNVIDVCSLVKVELLVGTALFAYLLPYSKIRALAMLLLGFSLVIAIRAAYTTIPYSQYVAANIILCFVAFLTSFWLSKESFIYRKAFPILLAGVFIYYGIRAFGDLIFVQHADGYRLSILFGHANHLSNVLSFAVIFGFSIVLCAKENKFHGLWWIPIFLLVLALVHTQSRGAWLGFIVGLPASVLYLKKNVSKKRLCLSVLVLVIMIATAAISASPAHIAKRFTNHSPDVKYSVGNRLLLWRYTVGIIRTHWLVGTGIASLGDELRRDKSIRFRNKGVFSSAMNNYLTIAVEAGIPTLALYLACLTYACTIAGKNIKGNGIMVGINAGLLCGVYSMLVFGLTTYTLPRVYATILVWSALGYVISQDAGRCVVQPNADSSKKSKTTQNDVCNREHKAFAVKCRLTPV